MLKDFRDFAVKGNVVDMAVGVIIGAAFGAIVSSLVADIIMPPIGVLLGSVDFANMFAVLKEGAKSPAPYATLELAKEAGAVTLNYGKFINSIVSFVIVAFSVFLLMRTLMKLKKNEPAPAAAPNTKECPHCCSQIPLNAKRCPQCTSTL